jgi:Histidine kinase-, DNA gyrase B-, and HSP90-like ATPase
MEDTSGELTVASKKSEGDQLLISVTDSGVGLPVEKTGRICEAFFATKPQGTGMGLSVSRRIVESFGGRLWASANPGPGATFHFTLRCAGAASSRRLKRCPPRLLGSSTRAMDSLGMPRQIDRRPLGNCPTPFARAPHDLGSPFAWGRACARGGPINSCLLESTRSSRSPLQPHPPPTGRLVPRHATPSRGAPRPNTRAGKRALRQIRERRERPVVGTSRPAAEIEMAAGTALHRFPPRASGTRRKWFEGGAWPARRARFLPFDRRRRAACGRSRPEGSDERS